MGHFKDTSVEITYQGKKYRVAKSDAKFFQDLEKKEKKEKPDKPE